ncbi:MAG: hypothetical protein AAF892_04155 [Cyanobacteria bacterium P01_D01_bin.71]
MVTAVSVLPINSQVLPGHNQETYQRLQVAVLSIPPHQIWLATCDDLPLQRQLAATLEDSLQNQSAIAAAQFLLDVQQPNVARQLSGWARSWSSKQLTLLQILGIEQLTYCSSDTQYQFLRSLHQLWPLWQQLDVSLLLWVPRPWLKQIRREVPQLAQSVFEFMGEPTPISAIAQQPTYQAAFSPMRRWQFLDKASAEAFTAARQTDVSPTVAPPPSKTVPAAPAEDSSAASDERPDSKAPPFSAALWHQLEADLSEFEITEATEMASPAQSENVIDLDESLPTVDEPPVESSTTAAAVRANELSPGETVGTDSGVSQRPDELPSEWAIAFDLRDRIQTGDQSPTTLAAAIQAYEQLQPRQTSIPQRTEVLNDLGSLYWLWAQQAQSTTDYFQRLLQSSEIYEAALSPLSASTDAGVLHRLNSNLGSVYSLLSAYREPPQYLRKAVRAFHRALQYAPVEILPNEYATLQTHLGTAYWSLAQHTQEPNQLHRAIAAYQEALHQSHPQDNPQAYAQLQNNLGIALWSLSRHERPAFLLKQAIGAYRTALAYRTLETDPAAHAATQNNLGTAYWDLGGHCEAPLTLQQQAWQQSIAAYEAAATAVDGIAPETLGFDIWATHHSVGVVYDQLAIALAPDTTVQEPLLTQATLHYVKALEGWQATEAMTIDTAFQALVRNLQLQARYLGIEAQQRSLSQIPATWLPDIWRQL